MGTISSLLISEDICSVIPIYICQIYIGYSVLTLSISSATDFFKDFIKKVCKTVLQTFSIFFGSIWFVCLVGFFKKGLST